VQVFCVENGARELDGPVYGGRRAGCDGCVAVELTVEHLFAACVARAKQARSDHGCVGVMCAIMEMLCDGDWLACEHPLF
jgi:hypothetical protein